MNTTEKAGATATAMRLTDAGSDTREFVSNAADRASEIKKKYVDPAWGKTRKYVNENPGKALLVSAAIGFLVGGLIFRRHRA